MFKVLIVEDDIHKLDSLTAFIHQYLSNSEVMPATNLKDAIEAVDSYLFDLILIDMAIPSHATVVV